MDEKTAKDVMSALAKAFGGLWFVTEDGRDDANGDLYRPGEGVARKRCRLAYGDAGDVYVTFCHGNTWVETVEDYVKACRWQIAAGIPDRFKADSAEELALRVTLSEAS